MRARRRLAEKRVEGSAYSAATLSRDPMAEQLAETFVATALSGEGDEQAFFDQVVPEELGGPFIETGEGDEFARGIDESNPRSTRREPFPRT